MDSVNGRSWVEQEVLYGLNLFILGNIHAVVPATGARVRPLSSDECLGSAEHTLEDHQVKILFVKILFVEGLPPKYPPPLLT